MFASTTTCVDRYHSSSLSTPRGNRHTSPVPADNQDAGLTCSFMRSGHGGSCLLHNHRAVLRACRNAMNPTPSPCVSTTTHDPEEANWPNVGNLTHVSQHEHPAQQHKTCATVGDAEALPRQRCSRSQLADQREHSTWHLATPGSDHQPRPLNHGKQPRMSRSDLRLTEAHHLRH